MVNTSSFNNYFNLNILKVISLKLHGMWDEILQWIIMKMSIVYDTNLMVKHFVTITLVVRTKQSIIVGWQSVVPAIA